ncbi:MAG: HAMP domain-containing protein [Thermodesulfobacteriota bacterium]
MGITLLLIAGSILLITSRWVRAPLSRVVRAMRSVEEGDLDVRVHLSSRDELGRGTRTFNSMVETLRKNKKDLVLQRQNFSRQLKWNLLYL